MSIGIFTDKAHQPTLDEVFSAVGSKQLAWEALTHFVADNYRVQGEWKFYGKNVRQAIASAHEYPEGRWLYIQVRSSKDVQDVQQLLALKSHPPKR